MANKVSKDDQVVSAIVLPWPPTVNTMYDHTRSGVHLSQKALAFRNTAGWMAKAQGVRVMEGPVRVRLRLYQPTRFGDIDNPIKATLDSLNGIAWQDDSQVRELYAHLWVDKENPRVEVTVEELVEEKEA